jgi:hypothetical protein
MGARERRMSRFSELKVTGRRPVTSNVLVVSQITTLFDTALTDRQNEGGNAQLIESQLPH